MRLRLKILVLLPLFLIGCASSIILHPITDKDIAVIQKGQPSPINGYVMSDYYLTKVIEAKIKAK